MLDAETRIGEILRQIPKDNSFKGNQYVSQSNSSVTLAKPKEQVIKEMGFTKMQVSRFETLAENKDIVEKVKQEAVENDDLPTRTEVLRQAIGSGIFFCGGTLPRHGKEPPRGATHYNGLQGLYNYAVI